MKRTPLKRYTPLRRSRPGKKSEPGSAAYLRWIRSLPCVICSGVRGPSEAAHTKVLGSAGMGQRSTYRSCIPLCSWDHTLRFDSYHEIVPENQWAELHNIDLPALVDQLNRAYGLMRSVPRRRAA
jgi:hypothetical protein